MPSLTPTKMQEAGENWQTDPGLINEHQELDPAKIIGYIGKLEGLVSGLSDAIRSAADVVGAEHRSEFLGLAGKASEIMGLSGELEDDLADLLRVHELMRRLTEKQDADYFLLSLLLQPFKEDKPSDGKLGVSSFLEQKKKCRFQSKVFDLGGDLVGAQNVVLAGREYLIAWNCDAMGKSSQGASGALIFGAMFNSIIKRTQTVSRHNNLSPERWIKNAFLDLQHVFEMFDGSMMVSMAMALIDKNTGDMYHINAGHPHTILYRGGKASFIETEQQMFKIGHLLQKKFISIRMLRLQDGDTIVMGSDGKDDIALDIEDGRVQVSDDDEAILGLVEKHAAGPDAIAAELIKNGGIMDDLSLLAVKFTRETPAAAKTEPGHFPPNPTRPSFDDELNQAETDPVAYHRLQKGLRRYVRKRDYDTAYIYAQKMHWRFASDNRLLLLTSFICFRQENWLEAERFAERLFIREPSNLNNCRLLKRIHDRLGNHERSQYFADHIVDIESTH